MKTGKRTGRWKYAAIVLLLALLLGLGLLWNNANNTSNSTDEIYLYGEWHSDSHILDRELEIWGEYYKKGMRDLFVEYPYTDAQFLNLGCRQTMTNCWISSSRTGRAQQAAPRS